MQEQAAREYLETLGNLLKDRVSEMEISDYGQGPVLILNAPAPFNQERSIAYTVSLQSAGEKFILFELMITVFSGIPEERFHDIAQIIAALNTETVIGSFLLFKKGNAVLYKQGILYDGETDINSSSDNMLYTLSLMENAVTNGALLLEDYFLQNKTADEIIYQINEMGGASL